MATLKTDLGLTDSGWITVSSFSNGWSQVLTTVQYRLQANVVRLRGAITGGTNSTTAFALPSGYWPSQDCRFPVVTSGEFSGQVVIQSANGQVGPYLAAGGPSGDTPLDGISFTID